MQSGLAGASVVAGDRGGFDGDTTGDREHFSFVLLLLEGLLGDRLESLFNVDGFLGRGLEIGDVALRLAPGVGTLGRDDTSVLHIDLVSQHDEGEILGISRRSLDQELLTPAIQVFEGFGHVHVEHQHAAVRTTVESHTKRSTHNQNG